MHRTALAAILLSHYFTTKSLISAHLSYLGVARELPVSKLDIGPPVTEPGSAPVIEPMTVFEGRTHRHENDQKIAYRIKECIGRSNAALLDKAQPIDLGGERGRSRGHQPCPASPGRKTLLAGGAFEGWRFQGRDLQEHQRF